MVGVTCYSKFTVGQYTCNVVSCRFIVVVVVAGRGCKPDVLTVDAVRWTECQTLEGPTATAAHTVQLLVNGEIVVDATQQSVIAERELVAGNQLSTARHAAETVDVVDVTARTHHQVGHAETELTAGTLGTE